MVLEYCINDKGNVGIECPHCHNVIELPITEKELLAWDPNKTFIQDQFPQLTPGQREMLLSGLCEECWNKLFLPEEDEEDLELIKF